MWKAHVPVNPVLFSLIIVSFLTLVFHISKMYVTDIMIDIKVLEDICCIKYFHHSLLTLKNHHCVLKKHHWKTMCFFFYPRKIFCLQLVATLQMFPKNYHFHQDCNKLLLAESNNFG